MAIILSSALGAYYPDDSARSVESSITDLYSRGLSSGKTDQTIKGFMPGDSLTRAEAVQFVYRFVNKSGLTSLKAVVSNDDWGALKNVTFADQKGILAKHELFAKKLGLQMKTYQQSGRTFIQLVSNHDSSNQTAKDSFLYSSSYQIADDGTLTWDLITNVDVADPEAAYELLASMFSYDTASATRSIKTLPGMRKKKDIKSTGGYAQASGIWKSSRHTTKNRTTITFPLHCRCEGGEVTEHDQGQRTTNRACSSVFPFIHGGDIPATADRVCGADCKCDRQQHGSVGLGGHRKRALCSIPGWNPDLQRVRHPLHR
ncbi:hypothetical protein [Paenibacillus sp.]|uniref:hypothetical protein n=1 Tax=Paenibacillus sp. TaxID=58172 RepID=UPI002D7FA72C|nr:hypothetical protein [Paenibacillus sp.]